MLFSSVFIMTMSLAYSREIPPEPDGSLRSILTPICQEITDHLLDLRYKIEIGEEEMPLRLAPDSNRIEAIAAYTLERILNEYKDMGITRKDIADMMFCRFAKHPDRCPRKEFLRTIQK